MNEDESTVALTPAAATPTVAEGVDERPDLPGVLPLLVSDEQAARMLGISRSLWRRQHSAGRVPMPVKIGRRTLWRREELRDWVSADCPPRHRWQWQGRAARKS